MKMLRVVLVGVELPGSAERRQRRQKSAAGGPVQFTRTVRLLGQLPATRRKEFARRGIADTRTTHRTNCIRPKLQRCGAPGGYPITRVYQAATNVYGPA